MIKWIKKLINNTRVHEHQWIDFSVVCLDEFDRPHKTKTAICYQCDKTVVFDEFIDAWVLYGDKHDWKRLRDEIILGKERYYKHFCYLRK